jgi:predicted heme/steroid binding protein
MSSSTTKRLITITAVFVIILQAFIFPQGSKFIHTATSSNIISNWTVIDNPSLNGNPNAIFFVTQNWNPPGGGGVYDTSEVGVWYDGSHWAIFNQDISAMPEGAAFNVFIPSGANDFVHVATNSNIISNWTVIDNVSLNGNPNAIFFITQNWNPPGGGGIYNTSPVGVWYDGSHWAIFNQNLTAMPEGAGFNVYIPSGTDIFVHTATNSNIISNWTVIDNPSLNGNPNAVFFITQNWNPPGGGGIYDNSATGVWYDGLHWAVFNQDLSAMPEGAAFNVYLATDATTGIKSSNDVTIQNFRLEQNYPNPFNPSTRIKYRISDPGQVTLDVVDILGRNVATLVNENKSAGEYEVNFNAGNLPSGIYFYHLKTGQYSETKKMILLR